ncbi:hypothetical protein PUN28_000103 [Cardiocondyla obscurior]|uniref:Receptor ligand binding region domain-containing protein n=1 Tax=Cardiocondyla obscurior TaxID=286306 RepID=A0AAW2GXS1_9HYME
MDNKTNVITKYDYINEVRNKNNLMENRYFVDYKILIRYLKSLLICVNMCLYRRYFQEVLFFSKTIHAIKKKEKKKTCKIFINILLSNIMHDKLHAVINILQILLPILLQIKKAFVSTHIKERFFKALLFFFWSEKMGRTLGDRRKRFKRVGSRPRLLYLTVCYIVAAHCASPWALSPLTNDATVGVVSVGAGDNDSASTAQAALRAIHEDWGTVYSANFRPAETARLSSRSLVHFGYNTFITPQQRSAKVRLIIPLINTTCQKAIAIPSSWKKKKISRAK